MIHDQRRQIGIEYGCTTSRQHVVRTVIDRISCQKKKQAHRNNAAMVTDAVNMIVIMRTLCTDGMSFSFLHGYDY